MSKILSFAEKKKRFHQQPTVNPETGKYIKIGGVTYNKLVKLYGPPQSRKSPSKIIRSPIKKEKDTFEFLSESSILNILEKLSNDDRHRWCLISPKVKNVCMQHQLL